MGSRDVSLWSLCLSCCGKTARSRGWSFSDGFVLLWPDKWWTHRENGNGNSFSFPLANRGLEISGSYRLAEVFCTSQTSGDRLPRKELGALSVSVTSNSWADGKMLCTAAHRRFCPLGSWRSRWRIHPQCPGHFQQALSSLLFQPGFTFSFITSWWPKCLSNPCLYLSSACWSQSMKGAPLYTVYVLGAHNSLIRLLSACYVQGVGLPSNELCIPFVQP